MKKCVNGELVELTSDEIAAMEAEAAKFEAAERTRPLTAEEVTAMLIKQQINTLEVDDNTALRMTEFYPEWSAGQAYTASYKVQYGGKLCAASRPIPARAAGNRRTPRHCGRRFARPMPEPWTILSRTAGTWPWNPAGITSRTM